MNPATAGSAGDDTRVEQLERAWFAAMQAASAARAECEALLDARDRLRSAWERARLRLLHLESLRDAIGDEITVIAGADAPVDLTPAASRSATKTAA